MGTTELLDIHLPIAITGGITLSHLPAELDGSGGVYRVQSPTLPAKYNHDKEAIMAWLAFFEGRTHEVYAKEAIRFWAWSVIVMRKPLSSITHQDVVKYRTFLLQPPAEWIAPKGRGRDRGQEGWRPFTGPLSPSSVQTCFMILRSMYRHFLLDQYTQINPFINPTRRKNDLKAKSADATTTRFLEEDLLKWLFEYVENYPKETERERATYERDRWILHLYYYSGIRREEGVANSMGDFYSQMDKGRTYWFINVTGKGNKTRSVSVGVELLDALMRYRMYKGLSTLPVPREHTALVMHLHSLEDAGGETIYQRIKEICKNGSDAVESTNPAAAARLRGATTHWMRHSRASHALEHGASLRDVMEELGHEDVRTTSVYLHSGKLARHERMNTDEATTENAATDTPNSNELP